MSRRLISAVAGALLLLAALAPFALAGGKVFGAHT